MFFCEDGLRAAPRRGEGSQFCVCVIGGETDVG
jgi:hypothetical protein